MRLSLNNSSSDDTMDKIIEGGLENAKELKTVDKPAENWEEM